MVEVIPVYVLGEEDLLDCKLIYDMVTVKLTIRKCIVGHGAYDLYLPPLGSMSKGKLTTGNEKNNN